MNAYSISDVKLGIEAEAWEVNIFLNDLTDERADLYRVAFAPPGVVRVNRPREVGVGFTRRWAGKSPSPAAGISPLQS